MRAVKIVARFFSAAAIMACVSFGSVKHAEAAPITLANGEIFDPEYYAQQNPDVVAAVGNSPQMLYQHYTMFGKAEGRLPYAGADSAAQQTQDPNAILAQRIANCKIEAFKGVWWFNSLYEDATLTWQGSSVSLEYHGGSSWASGYGRNAAWEDESALFNYAQYAADYPQVAAAVGNSKEALWQHYKTKGVYQGLNAYATTEKANAKLIALNNIPSIIAGKNTAYDRIKAVHDWLIANTDYDIENFYRGTIPERSYYIEGPMIYHLGVCNAYAETFDYFMYVLGIPCEVVNGYANGGDHAWNRIVLDGAEYFVDVTWDDNNYVKGWTKPEYTYFMVSFQKMSRDHYAEDYLPCYGK